MALPSTLFLIIFSTTLVFGDLPPVSHKTRRPWPTTPEEERKALTKHRQQRSMGSPQDDPLKVLDFSADNDDEPDSEGEFTSATLEIGALPESFTICSAFMVDAWTTKFTAAYMFVLMDSEERIWGRINLYAASSFTEYKVGLGLAHHYATFLCSWDSSWVN